MVPKPGTHRRLALVSLFLSGLLWLLVSPLRIQTSEFFLDFSFLTQDPNWIIYLDPSIASVKIRLKGPKWRLFLASRSLPRKMTIAMSHLGSLRSYYLLDSKNFSGPQFEGLTLDMAEPNPLPLVAEPAVSRTFPVHVDTIQTLPRHLNLETLIPKTPEVTLLCPRTVLESLSSLDFAPIRLSEMHASQSLRLRFKDRSLERKCQLLKGNLEAQITLTSTEANYRVKDLNVEVLSSLKNKVRPQKIIAFIHALEQDLERHQNARIEAKVDLKGMGPGAYDVVPDIILPPSWKLISLEPSTVQVILESEGTP